MIVAKDSLQRLYLDPATAQLLAWGDAPAAPATTRPGTVPATTPGLPLPGPDDTEATYSFAITTTSG